jgi:hypothetical protein
MGRMTMMKMMIWTIRMIRILCADAKSPVGKWLATIGILKG